MTDPNVVEKVTRERMSQIEDQLAQTSDRGLVRVLVREFCQLAQLLTRLDLLRKLDLYREDDNG